MKFLALCLFVLSNSAIATCGTATPATNQSSANQTISNQSIRVGDVVISSAGIPAVVKAIYSNGMVSIHAQGAPSPSRPISIEDFAMTQGCNSDNFCVGDKLTSSIGINARIVGLYSDGSVSIKTTQSQNYSRPVDPKEYFHESVVRRMNEIPEVRDYSVVRVGDILISSAGIPAVVKVVYGNGMASIHVQGAPSPSRPISIDDFAITQGCNTDNFCVGDKITSSIGINARIVGLYSDGRVSIKTTQSQNFSRPVDPKEYFCAI